MLAAVRLFGWLVVPATWRRRPSSSIVSACFVTRSVCLLCLICVQPTLFNSNLCHQFTKALTRNKKSKPLPTLISITYTQRTQFMRMRTDFFFLFALAVFLESNLPLCSWGHKFNVTNTGTYGATKLYPSLACSCCCCRFGFIYNGGKGL